MPKCRRSFTVKKKLSVLKWMEENNAGLKATGREFGIAPSVLRDWVRKKVCLQENSVGTFGKKRKLHPGPAERSSELDNKLFEFLVEQRGLGHSVSISDLQIKAREIAAGLDEDLGEFRASVGFILKWKKRFSVTRRRKTTDSRKDPQQQGEALRIFRENIVAAREECAIQEDDIFNMDQLMCWFDMPRHYTYDIRGTKRVRIASTGQTKKGFTVALCASATGVKLPAFLIFKERNGNIPPQILENLELPNNVIIAANKNGWMTLPFLHVWLQTVYGMDEEEANTRRLLVLDSYKPHGMEESINMVNDVCNSELVFVPPGCTPVAQPMDVNINHGFKAHMRWSWALWMEGPHDLTPAGNICPPRRQDVVNWVSAAWEAISVDTIVTGFKRCGISAALDGSEDHLLDPIFLPPQVQFGEMAEFMLNDEADDIPEDAVDIGDMPPFAE